ncbi:MAG: methyltransferase domain-containing protein [Cycloclasticus sp.]|nr:SAM-dependent methyltransferase [Cycloclasticus sp. 46_120_T64]
MAEGLTFDTQVSHALERAYQTPDIIAARQAVVKALAVQAGQSVLDIGSGPGLLARDLAPVVGNTGSVLGVDLADDMGESATKLCSDFSWVNFENADALSLPYADNSFDRVVSTQVYEYVADLQCAVDELSRVLKPGGYAVIVDTDWEFPYWNASDGGVRDRVIDAWKAHCGQQSVPLRLPAAIKSANLQLTKVQALPILNTSFDENSFSYWLSMIISDFARGRNGLTEAETAVWVNDLRILDGKGEYFFCINRYLFEIIK